MLIPVIRIFKTGADYFLKEIFINPRKIVYMSEEVSFKRRLLEGKINLGLHPGTEFTKIKLNMSDHIEEIILVGNPKTIESKFYSVKKLLRD